MKNPFENPRKILKNALLTTVAVTGMLATQEVKAGNGGGDNKPTIENLHKDHIVQSVDAKSLKKMLSGYEGSSELALNAFIQEHKDANFIVAEGVGQTQIAAKSSAEQGLNKAGKVSRYTFSKNLGNGNVSVILIAVAN